VANFPYIRIIVVGTTGSGKTTVARRLANHLHIPHIELDALHWEPNWTHVPDAELCRRIEEATRPDAWVVDGNYSLSREITWPRAQVVIWLDYPLWTVFRQLWRRIWRRWWTKELLWGNNREHLLVHFKLWSDESLIKWLFKTYWRRKKQYPLLFAKPENAHLKIIHLKTPRETETWFNSL
jgi:adenylate kinase family enzyme